MKIYDSDQEDDDLVKILDHQTDSMSKHSKGDQKDKLPS